MLAFATTLRDCEATTPGMYVVACVARCPVRGECVTVSCVVYFSFAVSRKAI